MTSTVTQDVDREHLETLYKDAIVIDGLGGDLVPSKLSQLKAGFTAINVTVASPHAGFVDVAKSIYTVLTYYDALPDKLMPIKAASDIEEAKRTGRLGVMIGLQDGSALEGSLPLLTVLHELGLRAMTLTYNERNALGDGCTEPHDQGITNFGQQVVRDMGRLGIVLDLTHSSYRTTMDAMEICEKPPIFSHSNPYSMTPSKRCIKDDQIQACVDLGGVIGISVWAPMACSDPNQQPTLDDYLDRIEYVVDKFGIDHVGIGTDIFEGKNPTLWRATTKRRYPDVVGSFEHHTLHAQGFESHGEILNVVEGLARRGYDDVSIQKVLGDNFLRVFKQVLS